MMNPKIKFSILGTLLACLGMASAGFGADQAGESVPRRTGAVTQAGKPLTLLGHEIKVGEKAPDFTVLNNQMRPVSLSEFAGKVRIITVFPSIDTKVCAMQARQFNQRAAQLEDVQILSISVDLPFALERFCAAEGIDKVLTLSDHRHTEFGLKYGFLIEELRLLARGTVIVDREGVVRYVEYVPELGLEPDYDRAIAVAKALASEKP